MKFLNKKQRFIKILPVLGIFCVLYCSEDAKSIAELTAAAKAVLDGVAAPVPVPPGDPAPPGQPENAPDLQDSTITSFDISSGTNFNGLFSIQAINYNLPVHDNTSVSAFIGGQSMKLMPDNTVVNSFSHWTVKAGQLAQAGASPPALIGPSDRKLKILIIARNEFGISSKVKQVGQTHFCTGAASLPSTVGNCGTVCATATLSGDNVEFKAQKTISIDTLAYLYVDISVSQPISFSIPAIPFSYFEIFDPIPVGTYEVTSSLNHTTFDYMCVEMSSYSYVDGPFDDEFIRGKVIIP
ncbi:hypothetical protein CH352_16185 [Leptospira hartskeerlii]|uniref:Uncharacterized protein n=1 Tax=Leptospira hartskeerlii TaxID=2023177 RepID=A0A2M9X9D3_9LEPT|nr:hypothetical protein [Leptospira hartskeerlii]PJZ24300.1 hypothetical protein CH357_16680 [Leptospira hartskeerlii]PJZ32485.1 hypothetical protein CH352_16185 [Leptospira hartskeerlii]